MDAMEETARQPSRAGRNHRVVALTFPVDLLDDVDQAAREEMINRSAFIRRLVRDAVRQRPTQQEAAR